MDINVILDDNTVIDRLLTRDALVSLLRTDIKMVEELPDTTIFLVTSKMEGARTICKRISPYERVISEKLDETV